MTFCLDLKENALAGSANFGTDIRVFNDWPANVFRLPGYAGGAFDQTAVMNYFAGRNTLTTKFASVPESGNGYSNTAACAQPPAVGPVGSGGGSGLLEPPLDRLGVDAVEGAARRSARRCRRPPPSPAPASP